MTWEPDEQLVEDFTNGYCWLLTWALVHEDPTLVPVVVAQLHEDGCRMFETGTPALDWVHTLVVDPVTGRYGDINGWGDEAAVDHWWGYLDHCQCGPEQVLAKLPISATGWARRLDGDPTAPTWESVVKRSHHIARDLLAVLREEAA